VLLRGSNNLVGSNGDGVNDAAERNIISGNSDRGVNMEGASNVVAGNYIGTDASGMSAIANNFGVRGGGHGGLITGNVVSGNGAGLQPDNDNVVVQGNLVGLDKTGETALANEIGIFLQFTGGPVLIGGATSQARNYITGNHGAGILIYNDLSVIQGNYIGRTPAGVDLGNGEGIAQLFGSTVIGGSLPGEGNVIAGNSNGIRLEENYPAQTGVDRIEGNLIVGPQALEIPLPITVRA
jgi:titin